MKKLKKRTKISLIVISVLLTVTAFALTKDRYADLQMFTKVLNLIEQHYVEEVDTKKLIYGGIKGMLSSLEPHSNFLPPEIFNEFKQETSGEFGGIGIEISVQNDVLTVISPIDDTPAYKAGIQAGDKIVEIEGKPTKGISLAEAVAKMRGKRGTSVTIGVVRDGLDKPKKYTIVRDLVKIRSVKYTDFGDGYLHIRITGFIENTGESLASALATHEKKSGKIKGLIIDLRNNAGGLLEQAIQVCNQFINEGVIVSTVGRNKAEQDVFYAKKSGARTDFPIVVLVNEYSASASEIVAGALQDHKRAAIMGMRTFGKGSVQKVIELGDGAGLKLTVSRYYTPKGRSIQAHGIEPDIIVQALDSEVIEKATIARKTYREADIEGHLINENDKKEEIAKAAEKTQKEKDAEDAKLSPKDRLLKKDYQVSQAFNYIKAWSVFKDTKLSGGEKTTVAAPAATPSSQEKPKDEKPKAEPEKKTKKKPAAKKAKPATSPQPAPSASPKAK